MATGELKLRSPYPPPSHSDPIVLPLELGLIKFRHPGYPDHSNILFAFIKSDDDGIHHETARLACAVVAGNRWDGFLCEDIDGQRRSVGGPDEILRGLKKYAITPTFSNWTFPHDDLPYSWENFESPPKPASHPQQSSSLVCSMTLNEEAVESAHLVPTAQLPWLNVNLMKLYTSVSGVEKMKDVRNIVRLRSDVHTIFNAKKFTIVPKQGVLVVHTFDEDALSEVYRLYHNVSLYQVEANVQFLFATFAYTVFKHLSLFLESGKSWNLRLVGEDVEKRECTSQECAQYAEETAFQGRSRSASLEEAEETDEENQRGRKRRRRGDRWKGEWWMSTSSTMSYMTTSLTSSTESESAVSVGDDSIDPAGVVYTIEKYDLS
ncbi:hypothetical protein MMC29_001806 [Sticta canariensis]|nr:hypothetical protein [Sticta canariensis]